MAAERRLRAIPAWVWLAGIVLASFALRVVLARRMVAPWIMVDELLYSELAKSFAAGGQFLVRDVPSHGLGFVYPVLISPAWRLFSSVPDAYVAAKTIGSLLMSTAAIPAYFLARRVVPAGLALVAAGLTVAVPSMVYTGTLMTENVFYPLFVGVALALVLVLERPTTANQLVLVALVAIAFLTRVQAVALVPAVLSAALLARARCLLVYALLVGGAAAAAAVELARGRRITDLLGAYRAATGSHYSLSGVVRFLGYHVGELDLYLGIVPFFALLLLLALRPPALRPFLAASSALVFWLVLEVAIFASSPSVDRIEERNLFYVAPLFFVALVAWIHQGAPRGRAAVACAAAAAALPVLVPYARFINGNATSDTLALLPLWTLQDTVISLGHVRLAVAAGAVVVAALALLAPPRVLPALVAALFAVALWPIETNPHGGIHQASLGDLFGGIARPDRDWIDRTIGRDARAAFLYTGAQDKFTVWQNEFFNRSVGPVYDLAAPTPGGLPEYGATIDARTGELAGIAPTTYVVTDAALPLAGRVLARDEVKAVVVRRVTWPLRLTYRTEGIDPDTWSGATAIYVRYRCRGGTLRVTLDQDPNLFSAAQRVTAGSRTFRVRGHRVISVPLRPAPMGFCAVRFGVSPTVVPGHGDTRRLGVHFSRFDYAP